MKVLKVDLGKGIGASAPYVTYSGAISQSYASIRTDIEYLADNALGLEKLARAYVFGNTEILIEFRSLLCIRSDTVTRIRKMGKAVELSEYEEKMIRRGIFESASAASRAAKEIERKTLDV